MRTAASSRDFFLPPKKAGCFLVFKFKVQRHGRGFEEVCIHAIRNIPPY